MKHKSIGKELRIRYTKKEILEICQLFKDLYGNSNGFVKLMCGKNRKGYFYSVDALTDPEKLAAILESRRFDIRNMYASLSAFKTMKKATLDNLLTVNALALDVDYTLVSGQNNLSFEEALKALSNAILDGFPMPTYIEYSRNMRLVYVFDEPFIIPKDKKKAESCRTFLKRTVQCMAEELNKYNDNIKFNATPHRLTSFIRIPYSCNKRSFGHYDYDEKRFITDEIKYYNVSVLYCSLVYDLPVFNEESISFKWDIQKLSECALPDLFDGYDEWKDRPNRKSKKVKESSILFSEGFCSKRLHELEELQRRGYDKGYRENLCYLYWITLRQNGLSDEDTRLKVCQFNKNFKQPLPEYRMLTECKPADYINSNKQKCEGWTRKFKDSSIREMLNLGSAEPDLFGGAGMAKSEKNKRYYIKKIDGKTKSSEIEQNMQKVTEMRDSGMKWEEIANALGVSKRTVYRYKARLEEK